MPFPDFGGSCIARQPQPAKKKKIRTAEIYRTLHQFLTLDGPSISFQHLVKVKFHLGSKRISNLWPCGKGTIGPIKSPGTSSLKTAQRDRDDRTIIWPSVRILKENEKKVGHM